MNEPQPDPEAYRFRGISPWVHLGTASDRYGGWIGQIYSPDRFARRVQRRTKTVGGRKFTEEVLPVECVEEYFDHFEVLELDFTFYRPLLDTEGNPAPNYRTLAAYGRHLGAHDRLILKVPQAIFAQKIRRGRGFEPNPAYLDPELFVNSFYRPASGLLGPHLSGLIFEQEYQRKADRQAPERLAADLDRFFEAIPEDDRYHVELRTEEYLSPPVFEILEKRGVGQVLSHWTWLPSLRRQFNLGGERFLSRGGQAVVRLMTPRGVRYEDAYAAAHPFDKKVEGMATPGLIEDTLHLARVAVDRRVELNVIVNNRAGGNAPSLARDLAAAFLQEG